MTIHNIERDSALTDQPAGVVPVQEREIRSTERVPPYGDAGPMDNSGFGGALAVAFFVFLALASVLAMNVRHENQASNSRSQSAAMQTPAPAVAPTPSTATQ